MDSLVNKLEHLLTSRFKDAEVDLERFRQSKKVGGFLIWKGFEGKEQIKRQQAVWKLLRAQLTKVELQRLTAILTLTPAEAVVEQED